MITIGAVYKKGRDHVYVTSGRYMGQYGVSNFWNYKKIKPDGSLSVKELGCYGGEFGERLYHAKVEIRVKI